MYFYIVTHMGQVEVEEHGNWLPISMSYKQDAGVREHRFRAVQLPDDGLELPEHVEVVFANTMDRPATITPHAADAPPVTIEPGRCLCYIFEFGDHFTVTPAP